MLARVAKLTYGTAGSYIFNIRDPEHLKRMNTVVASGDGTYRIPEAFAPLLEKVDRSKINSAEV